jgi:hypothetical protein
LPEVEVEKTAKKAFKSYPIGFLHLDIAEVRTEEGKPGHRRLRDCPDAQRSKRSVSLDAASRTRVVDLIAERREAARRFATRIIDVSGFATT